MQEKSKQFLAAGQHANLGARAPRSALVDAVCYAEHNHRLWQEELASPRLRYVQRLGLPAQGGVVGDGEVEVETKQVEDGVDRSCGLAQSQAEHRPQRRRRDDRPQRVVRLPVLHGARFGRLGPVSV